MTIKPSLVFTTAILMSLVALPTQAAFAPNGPKLVGTGAAGSNQGFSSALSADGNTAIGKHLGIRSSGCIVRTGEHLVVTLGVQDCVVVHTPDATLVASKQEEEAIREVVKALEERGWREYL